MGADALLNPLYSFPCCPDQYSCCSFTCFELHDKGEQGNFTWTPAQGGDQMCAGVVIYAEGKGTPGTGTQKQGTAQPGSFCWLL